MLALEAPLLKLTLAAGALATIAALAPARHHHDHGTMHRLVLHTERHAGYVYLSMWELNHYDVWANVDPHHLTPIQFEIRGDAFGCLWQGNETLLPDGDHYDYSYEDHIVKCGPNPIPTIETPRSGTVTIE